MTLLSISETIFAVCWQHFAFWSSYRPWLTRFSQISKYLKSGQRNGVILSKDLGWGAQVTYASNKAIAVLNMLRRQLRGTTEKTRLTLYKSLICPILEYAFAVNQQHQLEQVQRRAVGWILNPKWDDSVSLNQISIGLEKIVDRMQWKDLKLLEDIRSENIVYWCVKIYTAPAPL